MSGEKLISKFNEAGFQISRLHNLWLQCTYNRERRNLIKWKWLIDSATIGLWCDIIRLDGDEEEESYISKLKIFDKNIGKIRKKELLESYEYPELNQEAKVVVDNDKRYLVKINEGILLKRV